MKVKLLLIIMFAGLLHIATLVIASNEALTPENTTLATNNTTLATDNAMLAINNQTLGQNDTTVAANNTTIGSDGNNQNTTSETDETIETTKEKENGTSIEEKELLHAIFWEVKPFIFKNSKGEIDGIIPQIFEQASVFCNGRKPFIHYKVKMDSRRDFYDLARSNVSYHSNTSVLKSVDKQRAFWAPVLSPTNTKNDGFLKERALRSFQILKTTHISIIVRRDLISLPNKIFRGIMACEQIFVLAILLAIIVGIFLWVIERYQNTDFPNSFCRGAMTGLYWSIVSMTTVGYGDIQPSSAVGRFVTCFWLFIGVMVGCVMTATVTDVVAGNDFDIQNKKVAVLENSFEERTAEKQYRTNVVSAKSYDEVLEMVRKQEVFAAMMNSDVAAWYDEIISDDTAEVPLRMVAKLPANLYVHCLLPTDLLHKMKVIFKCMYYQKDEVYTFAEESFKVHHHPQNIYIGSTGDLMSENVFCRAIIGLLAGLIVLGFGFDGWKYVQFRVNTKKHGATNGENKEMTKYYNSAQAASLI
ncbi:uncharacterized protein [Clytia hemisphaerica]|uniref:Potassium channel domain-containing protein n=1 Tax=Clytia hemisphaerica TaxID=252671 RepID=A0A7M5UFI3_9CNID